MTINELTRTLWSQIKTYKSLRSWCEDESRIGLKTITAKKLTLKGVQPVGIEQWQFEYLWLSGLIEPQTGESFFSEFCDLDSICFEKYLELFAQKYPDDFQIIQLDNRGLHSSLDLVIPDNIVLLFQPPYSPQVNPIERFWKELKKKLRWQLFENLDELRNNLSKQLNQLTPDFISSLSGWTFILEALSVANI